MKYIKLIVKKGKKEVFINITEKVLEEMSPELLFNCFKFMVEKLLDRKRKSKTAEQEFRELCKRKGIKLPEDYVY